jgi:hypothetical protein
VGPRAVVDAVVKRKIPSPSRESKPRTAIVQPVAQLENKVLRKISGPNKAKIIESENYMTIFAIYAGQRGEMNTGKMVWACS